MSSPYSKFLKEELILRDLLAIDRTILANESTFLAYIRTSLAVIAVGATLIHFFESVLIRSVGGLFVIIGIGILLFGYKRFKKMSEMINEIRNS